MIKLETISQGLEAAAARRPDKGKTFVRDDGTELTLTYPQLLKRAKELAVALNEKGVRKGDRVALVLPYAEEFVPTFLGVVQAGAVPVPLYPPMGLGQLGGYLDHCKHIVNAAKAKVLVTTGQVKAVLGTLHEAAPELRAMVTYKDLEGDASLYRDPNVSLEDLCFIQFTSGSTSRPKGVVVSYRNLAENCHAVMRDGLHSNDEDRGVSWLPLFHDMGLIGFVIAPILHAVPVSFLPTLGFLKRPGIWLQTLSKHRGTITYAPNFAYGLCTKRVREEELVGVDLSSVRVAGCGAEPIQADVLRNFAKHYARWGFKESAFVPSYGMAENTLAISFSTGIPIDRVHADTLWEKGEAKPVDAGTEGAVEIVNCGKPFPRHQVRVAHTETGEVLSERRVGELQLQGPSVTAGYYEDPEKTAEVMTPDGWLRTGDLGYLVNGSVVICGRKKDVIIINGKNFYPQDLEWAAARVEGIRLGNVIAFAAHKAGLDREALVLVAESKDVEKREQLSNNVRQEIQRTMGVMPDDVVIADTGTIPKTSSGKLQRSKARQLYESGELKKREAEGNITIAKRVLESQLSHLKLSIFGSKK